jgi:hypothetical protein
MSRQDQSIAVPLRLLGSVKAGGIHSYHWELMGSLNYMPGAPCGPAVRDT